MVAWRWNSGQVGLATIMLVPVIHSSGDTEELQKIRVFRGPVDCIHEHEHPAMQNAHDHLKVPSEP